MADRSKPLTVSILSPEKELFNGRADRVVFPGEAGVFEVLAFHQPLICRLLSGTIVIDTQQVPIYRGVAQIAYNHISVVVETAPSETKIST